jgi:hypothetical protein
MTRTAIQIVVALAVSSAGCGRHVADNTPAVPERGPFRLRVTGVDKGDVLSAFMRVKSVQVSAGSTVLANAVKTAEFDLAEVGQSFLLASFDAPAGVEDVDFLVAFESGRIATGKGSFDLDVRCQTLRLSGKVSRISERKHAVIHLDVARSFVPSPGGLALVPQFQLVY